MSKKILDKKLLAYLILFYVIAFCLSAATGLLAKWEGYAYKSFSWAELISNTLLRYSAKFLFVLFGIWLVKYLSEKVGMAKWLGLILHGLFGIILTFYSVSSQVILNNWMYGLEDPVTFKYIYSGAILGTDYNFFLYFCSIAIVYAYDYFKSQKDSEIRESTLKTQLLDAKINALQSQLQPHFLFNTLNDITSLVQSDPLKAQESIVDLSELLRQTLKLSDKKFVSLEEELVLLDKYMAIEKIRYDDKLRIRWEISEGLLGFMVPPLLLQPLIENAIKHGFSFDHDYIEIRVTAIMNDGYICFEVENNGAQLKEKAVVYGVGLGNIISRLDTLYKGDFNFEIANKSTHKGVIAKVSIPTQNNKSRYSQNTK